MRMSIIAAGLILAGTLAPAFAGENGGDREPAGGAFRSSYGNNGRTTAGPPRSADVPRGREPGATGSILPEQQIPAPRR